ncbi:hypothetical protein HOT45_gp49 [Gordonia phage Trine]|uniref:Uncharacterized protein n=1 Tax=Gordonia phage Trine TaxID=2201431 RepID=A0A2Z4Q9B2_9CAUD|nr:hypothetical protein HOT45_gp49 [Gordonia phage Trine]AWY06550.1 hypothetical protein PBI_TRINE_49 [Gordonia phage Trine]
MSTQELTLPVTTCNVLNVSQRDHHQGDTMNATTTATKSAARRAVVATELPVTTETIEDLEIRSDGETFTVLDGTYVVGIYSSRGEAIEAARAELGI